MKEIFDIAKLNTLSPEKGLVLISEPFNEDKYFQRSVICLCEHNDKGSFGYVVNNTLDVKLTELIPAIKSDDFKVGLGGPVSPNNLYYMHTLGKEIEGSVEVKKGLYTGGNFDQITTLINTGLIGNHQIQFFLGYSGWSSGQLEDEIAKDSWIVSQFDIIDVMERNDETYWKNILASKGGKFQLIANFPLNPSLN
ncbi:MAG: YqgE/AlgH family protein [Flavobacteriales bacterium]|jgi:putative transcriptional regulator|nr:YqgE/AlgH family protein [Flavobacteriales bacterium]